MLTSSTRRAAAAAVSLTLVAAPSTVHGDTGDNAPSRNSATTLSKVVTVPATAEFTLRGVDSVTVTSTPPPPDPSELAIIGRAVRVGELRSRDIPASDAGIAHPVHDATITSRYGPRPAIRGVTPAMFHEGVDLAAPVGTPIRAAATGTVTYVGYGHETLGLTGWVILINHGSVTTGYNHMFSNGVLVEPGDVVTFGDVIALVGNSGKSSGPHAHVSVWVEGEHINPETWFANAGVPL